MTDDLISREDAIKAIRESKAWHFYDLITVLGAIKELPSAQPKQGEWIRIEWNESIEGYIIPMRAYKCSACGEKETESTRFCPNCGARMTEREGK